MRQTKSMHRLLNNILVTGGCGFIGSAFIRYLFTPEANFTGRIINMDCLTYAANKNNVKDIDLKYGSASSQAGGGERYFFIKADIADKDAVMKAMREYNIDTIVNFAAESHVDRSITGPALFMHTNIMGTYNLLECARECYAVPYSSQLRRGVLFHQAGTDEVYGDAAGAAGEDAALLPSSPYSASKAAADCLCLSWHRTYGLPVTITRSSNNYGPCQYGEKFLPLMIEHIKKGLPLPVYGEGLNVRDWIHVDDNVRAIWAVLQGGEGIYNVAGGNAFCNIDLLNILIKAESAQLGIDAAKVKKTITHVPDRAGHDGKYCMNCQKIQTQLLWKPRITFDEGLCNTIKWYLIN